MAKKLYLAMANGTQIKIRDCSVLEPHVIAAYPSKEDMDAALAIVQEGNLSTLTIKRGSNPVLTFEDCVLEGYQVYFNVDGTLTTHYYFRDHAHTPAGGGMLEDDDEEEEEE
ncbi:MAG: hypothetical protein IKN04_07185 [Clostridia bacterium]|nr:hypothetical protein [Clostridia bacterium]